MKLFFGGEFDLTTLDCAPGNLIISVKGGYANEEGSVEYDGKPLQGEGFLRGECYIAPFGPPTCEGPDCRSSMHGKEWHFTVNYQVCIDEGTEELEDRKALLILGSWEEDPNDWDLTVETSTGFKTSIHLGREPTLLRAVGNGG